MQRITQGDTALVEAREPVQVPRGAAPFRG